MKNWLALVMALPTSGGTERMRAWRALKSSGAAVLRDGVYLLPHSERCERALQVIEHDILKANGMAMLLPVNDPNGSRFIALFDRQPEYAKLQTEIAQSLQELSAENALAATRRVRKLRKAFAQIDAIDFFPGPARAQSDSALKALEIAVNRALSPDEPSERDEPIQTLSASDYRCRLWATRQRPWIDRLASAWLISRFIDPQATFLWLTHPADCPAHALGFDFDGADFSHVGNRVTFEVLAESFSVQAPGLGRVASLVHYLDVGGTQPPEAAGVERVLAGLRETLTDDDALLSAAAALFDGLLAGFSGEEQQ